MATTISKPQLRTGYDHVFFQAFAALIAVIVFVGFAQTYYLSGVLKVPQWKAGIAPPHPWMVEIHGAIFTSWVLLLVVQTSLTRAGRVDLHRKLGVAGMVLAFLLVLAGVGVISESIARHFRPGDPRISPAAAQALWLAGFAVLVLFAYVQRRNPRAHKRLMLMATIILLPAPLTRWPVLIAGNFPRAMGCCYALMILVACYDLWSTRKIQAATIWGSIPFLVTHPPIVIIFVKSALWFRVAVQMQAMGRHML